MVSLYKDPDGVTVFTANDVHMEAHTQATLATLPTSPEIPIWTDLEVDSLRKRVKTLETAIIEYKVAITVTMTIKY